MFSMLVDFTVKDAPRTKHRDLRFAPTHSEATGANEDLKSALKGN